MTRGAEVPRSRARRRALLGLVVLLAIPVGLVLLLRLEGVRARLLSEALARAEASTGLSLEARSLSLDPWSGRLRVEGLSASVRGSRPFLTVGSAVADVDVARALRGRLRVLRLSLDAVRVDLGAPLPVSREPSTGELPFLSAADVDAIDVSIASIVSGPLPASLGAVASGAGAEGARLAGSLRDGTLRLRGDLPAAHVERGATRLAARGGFALSLTRAGRLHLEEARLAGEGFSASASGDAGLPPLSPLALRLEARARPEAVAPELRTKGSISLVADVAGTRSDPAVALAIDGRDVASPAASFETFSAKARLDAREIVVEEALAALRPGGRVEARGRVDLASGDGSWTLRAERLPDALLDPFASAKDRARWGLAGSALDVEATLRHGRGDPLPLSADATLSLRRGDTPLALATARLASRGETRLDAEATLLPGSAGTRTASASVSSPSLAALASGRLVEGRLRADVPDLAGSLAELRALFPALVPTTLEGVDLRGALRLDARASGPLRAPRARVEAALKPATGGAWSLLATADVARRSAEGTLSATGISAGAVRPGASGLASADAAFALGRGRRDVRVALDAAGLCLDPALPPAAALHASLEVEGDELRVLELAAEGEATAAAGLSGARASASGRASLEAPFRDADLDLSLSAGGLAAVARAAVRDGVLSVDVPRAGRPGLEAAVGARLPLGALADLPALAGSLPPGLPRGPVELTVDAPGLDTCALEGVLPEGAPRVSAVGDLRGFATFDLRDPLAGSASVTLERLEADSPAGRLSLAGPARATLGGGHLALEALTVTGERTSFVVSAEADLVPGAQPGAPLPALLARVSAAARGRADAALLTPLLAGGTAAGEVSLDARAAGAPDALEGRVSLDGTGSRFSWAVAFPTEVRDVVLEAELTPGSAKLVRGEAVLNGGPLQLSGGWYAGVGTTLTALFSDVRYRLSYGLASVLSGDLTLDVIGDERRVSGDVTLERGLLERDVDLDREILARILAPPESPGTEASFLDTLALDVGVGTTSGIRVRNNVADLSASWSRLEVTGTARRPIVRGRVDVDRNGLVFAYGQTFRIDRGTVTYTGDPATDPRLDFVTTSSLTDPTIASRAAGEDLFASARGAASSRLAGDDAAAQLARGLAGYYGDRLAGKLGAALGRVSLAFRPLLLLGEADPAARLTLSRDLSQNVSLAVGIDLKNAQRQTWVVDVHGIRRLPPLAAQLFTEDFGRYGGTLQQRIELGGGRRRKEEGAPLLDRLRVSPPRGVPKGGLVAATGLRKGEPAGRAALFEGEIDAETFLRGKGWPDAVVTLRAVAASRPGRVDVEATVDPGPRVAVSFAGDRLPAAARGTVAGLYRTGLLEAGALDEMRRETLRALRSAGRVSPEVEISVGGDEAARRVLVTVRAGPRVDLREVAFEGVTPEESGRLARRFATPLERTELAAALPSADERLVEALRALGYPRGRVLDREREGKTLAVRLDPGPPSLVESVAVRGVPPEEAERLARLVRVAPGGKADADGVALSALAMEDALRAGGHAQARVRTVLAPATPEDPPRLAVAFDVASGAPERLGSVEVAGLSRTSARWARRVAGLEPGAVFRREDVDAARGRLFALGLFGSVRGEVAPGPGGREDVVLDVEELAPFAVAYGVRWENERGVAAVVDVADRNVLGRGLALGARLLWDPGDRAARAFAGLPERVLGLGLDVWVERRRTIRDGLLGDRTTDSTEASLQLSRSFGPSLSARLYGRWKETRVVEDDPFFPLDVTVDYPYAGAQLVWDTREDPLLGTRGLLASLDVAGSGSWLASSFAFARAYGQVNVYRPVFPFGSGRAVWAQSVRAGLARAFEGQELIPDVRFFAGGSYSVRGYPTESLGPREELGGTLFATGGSALLVLNEELRVPLHPRLLVVGFVDAGQVWASSRDFGSRLATSAGLGLRALTPLGVLRLDAARPLSRREGDPAWRVTFGFGNAF